MLVLFIVGVGCLAYMVFRVYCCIVLHVVRVDVCLLFFVGFGILSF